MKKVNSKEWHFDFIPVTKEESDRIREQIKDGIPPNMLVISAGCLGERIECGEERLRHEV